MTGGSKDFFAYGDIATNDMDNVRLMCFTEKKED